MHVLKFGRILHTVRILGESKAPIVIMSFSCLLNPFCVKRFIIITTCKVQNLSAVAETLKKNFYLNRSSDESVYVIELNLVSFFACICVFLE